MAILKTITKEEEDRRDTIHDSKPYQEIHELFKPIGKLLANKEFDINKIEDMEKLKGIAIDIGMKTDYEKIKNYCMN